MVINDNYKLVPEAKYLFTADMQWWYQNYYAVPEAIDCYTLDGHPTHLEKRLEGSSKRLKGISFTMCWSELSLADKKIHHGGNSGYMGIQLTAILGYTKIILIGFDHQHTYGKRHWFGDHDKTIFRVNADNVEKWVDSIDRLGYYLSGIGLDLINCSNETAITSIRRPTLDKELD